MSDFKVELHPKYLAYSAHVQEVRECSRCGSSVHNFTGCKHPSPWAEMMGSLDARIVAVGKDFSGSNRIGTSKPWDRPDPSIPTNRNLLTLIEAAGLSASDVFLTNAMLCLKSGHLSAHVDAAVFQNCAMHLRRTIEVVRPLATVTLGGEPHTWLMRAFNLRSASPRRLVGRSPLQLSHELYAFTMYHPGHYGTMARPLPEQVKDWRLLGGWLRQMADKPNA